APRAGLLGVGKQVVGHAVGRYHARFVGHAKLRENLHGVLHGVPVAAGAHDHANHGLAWGSAGARGVGGSKGTHTWALSEMQDAPELCGFGAFCSSFRHLTANAMTLSIGLETLFDHLEAGIPLDEFLDDFPTVSREQAIALLDMATKLLTAKNVVQLYAAAA
nr:hypothetical protein [Tanacetum cinerariifolium]